MKQLPLREHLQNRLIELKEEKKSLKRRKLQLIKEYNSIIEILKRLEDVNS